MSLKNFIFQDAQLYLSKNEKKNLYIKILCLCQNNDSATGGFLF